MSNPIYVPVTRKLKPGDTLILEFDGEATVPLEGHHPVVVDGDVYRVTVKPHLTLIDPGAGYTRDNVSVFELGEIE